MNSHPLLYDPDEDFKNFSLHDREEEKKLPKEKIYACDLIKCCERNCPECPGKARCFGCCKVPCRAKFARRPDLTRHKNSVHRHLKPFECEWEGCGKKFSQAAQLHNHFRVHTRDVLFHCSACPISFTDSSSRSRHMKERHSEMIYFCPFCPSTVARIGAFKTHLSNKHAFREHEDLESQEASALINGLFRHPMSYCPEDLRGLKHYTEESIQQRLRKLQKEVACGDDTKPTAYVKTRRSRTISSGVQDDDFDLPLPNAIKRSASSTVSTPLLTSARTASSSPTPASTPLVGTGLNAVSSLTPDSDARYDWQDGPFNFATNPHGDFYMPNFDFAQGSPMSGATPASGLAYVRSCTRSTSLVSTYSSSSGSTGSLAGTPILNMSSPAFTETGYVDYSHQDIHPSNARTESSYLGIELVPGLQGGPMDAIPHDYFTNHGFDVCASPPAELSPLPLPCTPSSYATGYNYADAPLYNGAMARGWRPRQAQEHVPRIARSSLGSMSL